MASSAYFMCFIFIASVTIFAAITKSKVDFIYSDYNCSEYQSCFNKTIYSPSLHSMSCGGAESCTNCHINASSLDCNGELTCSNSKLKNMGNWTFCNGYGSCLNSNITSNSLVTCWGQESCSHLDLEFSGNLAPSWMCPSFHSCSNSFSRSPSSYSKSNIQDTRTITIYLFGVFSMYNTTFYSNDNDLYILAAGYYGAYGLSVYCGVNDMCTVECLGNGCVGLKIKCGGGLCDIVCEDDICNTYMKNKNKYTHHQTVNTTAETTLGGFDEDDIMYDEMVDLINGIFSFYDENFTLTSVNSGDMNWIKRQNNVHCKDSVYMFGGIDEEFFNGGFIDFNIYANATVAVNSNICCLGELSCYNTTVIGPISNDDDDSDIISVNNVNNINNRPNLYCAGVDSCTFGNFSNLFNIYASSLGAFYGATVTNFDGMMICSGAGSCPWSSVSNGKVLACLAYFACDQTLITNVEIVIGLGAFALNRAIISNVTKLFILSPFAGSNASVENITDNFYMYCQNDGCAELWVYYLQNNFYCYHTTDIALNLSGSSAAGNDDNYKYITATNVSNLKYCTIVSLSPTVRPTSAPTESQFQKELGIIVAWLQNGTVLIAIGTAGAALSLVLVSIVCHNKKHKKTMNKYRLTTLSCNLNYNEDNNNGGGDIDEIGSFAMSDDGSDNGSVLSYASGFGKSSNHVVIFQMGFEIYDVFTDVAYLIELLSSEYFISFSIFLSSMGITLIINIGLLIFFVKNAFQNSRFQLWFFDHSGAIILLMFLCLLTDASMVVSLFTSQIFGNLVFYSPMSLRDIKTIKTAALLSIFIEHLPQLLVQCYVLLVESKQFTSIMIASLVVSGIDTLFITVKICIWFVVFREINK